jgi:hypothetical protein
MAVAKKRKRTRAPARAARSTTEPTTADAPKFLTRAQFKALAKKAWRERISAAKKKSATATPKPAAAPRGAAGPRAVVPAREAPSAPSPTTRRWRRRSLARGFDPNEGD